MSQPLHVSTENSPAVDDCHEEAGKRYRASSLLVLLAIGLFVLLVTRRAWLSDDGFITFRTVDNFVNGYGLTWNVAERVQAYTHPLWMFTLSIASFITRELPLTCLAVSIVMASTAVILLGTRVAVSETAAALGILALALSPSFVDYSTSGLENPLSYLLLVIFFALYFGQGDGHKKLFLLSLVASFAITNRLDLSLLLLPALAYSFWQLRDWKALCMVVLGQVPFLLWEVFSILYYGFPFPNTVYAKMNTGISTAAYARQGLVYLLDSLNANPMTLLLIIVSLALVVLQGDWRKRAVAGGIILYLIYVVRIGGDFMSERFLTIPYLCAVIILVRYDFSRLASHAVVVIFLLVLTLSQFAGNPVFRSVETPATLEDANRTGIVDERRFYVAGTGLRSISRTADFPNHDFRRMGENDRAQNTRVKSILIAGMQGYYAGPDVHFIDEMALCDALLARLPIADTQHWRIGHMHRAVPAGYEVTISTGRNYLADPDLALYYDKLALIIREDVFASDRLATIWKMNTGQYEYLLRSTTSR